MLPMQWKYYTFSRKLLLGSDVLCCHVRFGAWRLIEVYLYSTGRIALKTQHFADNLSLNHQTFWQQKQL